MIHAVLSYHLTKIMENQVEDCCPTYRTRKKMILLGNELSSS